MKSSKNKLDMIECYGVIHGLASAFNVQSYLEIGVREGASLCCAVAREKEIAKFALWCLADGKHYLTQDIITKISELYSPRNVDMKVYLFDNWSYEGCENGRGHIEALLTNGFAMNNYEIFDGDSKETVPKFFLGHKEKVDLAFVDGDHEVEGATTDLENVWRHAKVLVVHDLFHPGHECLYGVFLDFCKRRDLPYVVLGKKVLGTGIIFNLW